MAVTNSTRGVKKGKAAKEGQYTIHPTSIDDGYDGSGYQYQPYPKMLHGRDADGALEIIVHNDEQRDAMLAKGWSLTQVAGPQAAVEPVIERKPLSAEEIAALPIPEPPAKPEKVAPKKKAK